MKVSPPRLLAAIALASLAAEAVAQVDPEGPEWRLLTLGNDPLLASPGGRPPTLRLDRVRKKATGSTGCNDFQGPYDLRGTTLTFGPLGTTRRACADAQSRLESRFLEVLARTRSWRAEGGELLLQDAGVLLARLGREPRDATSLDPFTFRSKAYPGGPVTLVGGEYRAPAAPGAASEVAMRLTEARAFGTVAGRRVGAVVVSTSTGGSGQFQELALLVEEGDGWANPDTVVLGDRVKVRSISLHGDEIAVAVMAHAPGDPQCCPTREVERRFAVRDARLVLLSEASSPGRPTLVGPVWRWVQTRYNDGRIASSSQPERYTVRFVEGGQVEVRADCNRKGGTYAVDGKRLSISIRTSTMASCEPGSLEDEFVRSLAGAATFLFEGADLLVDIRYDTGTMRFSAR